jgi:hypothetical protein
MKEDPGFANAMGAFRDSAGKVYLDDGEICKLCEAYEASIDPRERQKLLAKIIETPAYYGLARGYKQNILQELVGRDTPAGQLLDSVFWDFTRPGGQLHGRIPS